MKEGKEWVSSLETFSYQTYNECFKIHFQYMPYNLETFETFFLSYISSAPKPAAAGYKSTYDFGKEKNVRATN